MYSHVLNVAQGLINTMRRGRQNIHNLKFNNTFEVEHIRDGKVIGIHKFKNDIVNVGKNLLLDAMFFGATQVVAADWCLGLISNSGYSALAAADTMSSHAGWTEFTGYSQSTRVAWGHASSTAQSTTNSSPVTFDITSTGTVKGIFVTSEDTKGGTTGTLWATALFNADVPVVNGDQFRITYTVNA